jgi:hypothetical protein
VRGFLILVSMAVAGWPQDFGPPKPIFPSDGMDPKQGGGAELLEAVCPGSVDFHCTGACPESTRFGLAGTDAKLNWAGREQSGTCPTRGMCEP